MVLFTYQTLVKCLRQNQNIEFPLPSQNFSLLIGVTAGFITQFIMNTKIIPNWSSKYLIGFFCGVQVYKFFTQDHGYSSLTYMAFLPMYWAFLTVRAWSSLQKFIKINAPISEDEVAELKEKFSKLAGNEKASAGQIGLADIKNNFGAFFELLRLLFAVATANGENNDKHTISKAQIEKLFADPNWAQNVNKWSREAGINIDVNTIHEEIITEIFALVDLNADEEINFHEFALATILLLAINSNDEEALMEVTFKLLDLNNDSQISFDEILYVVKSLAKVGHLNVPERLANKAGEIDPEEVASFYMDKYDMNKDGVVTYGEFKKIGNIIDKRTMFASKRLVLANLQTPECAHTPV